MYLTLYRKYRPQNFNEVCGQSQIMKILKNSLNNNNIAHAYLFSGPRGVGKTTVARLIAKGINCVENGISANPCGHCVVCNSIKNGNYIDLIEIDAASNRGIDAIRSLREKVSYGATSGRKKIYIIDEVHMLTTEASNALLKTLEEPPEHVIFILATTEPDKILDTIISRCQRFDFSTMKFNEMSAKILEISKIEEFTIDAESLMLIHEHSEGSMRDAYSILEKLLVSLDEKKITIDETQNTLGILKKDNFIKFDEILNSQNVENTFNFIDDLWLNGIIISNFFKQYCYFLKDTILVDAKKISEIEKLEIILQAIYVLKNEEDERLIGYIICGKLLRKHSHVLKQSVNDFKSENIENNTQIVKEKKSVEIVAQKFNPTEVLEKLKKQWEEIISKLGRKKISLLAFLSGTQPTKIEDDQLFIFFNEKNSYHKISMSKSENLGLLKDLIFEITNIEFKINFIVPKTKQEQVNDDIIIQTILDVFEGEIVE